MRLSTRHHVRAQALIAGQHQHVADDHRRGAHAVDVAERAERHGPELRAGGVVGDQAVVREEHVDAVAFDCRTRRRGVVALVDRPASSPPAPARSHRIVPRCRSIAIVTSVVAAERGEVDAIAVQDRRRVARRQRQPPQQILAGTELGRHLGRRRQATDRWARGSATSRAQRRR